MRRRLNMRAPGFETSTSVRSAAMELNGGWVAVEANDDIRRHGIELDTDDA